MSFSERESSDVDVFCVESSISFWVGGSGVGVDMFVVLGNSNLTDGFLVLVLGVVKDIEGEGEGEGTING